MFYIFGSIVYLISASLPIFLSRGLIGTWQYYVAGGLMATLGSIAWLSLARSINTSQLSLYGLKWDVMITVCYLVVPFVMVKQELNSYNVVGIVFALTGVVLLKI